MNRQLLPTRRRVKTRSGIRVPAPSRRELRARARALLARAPGARRVAKRDHNGHYPGANVLQRLEAIRPRIDVR